MLNRILLTAIFFLIITGIPTYAFGDDNGDTIIGTWLTTKSTGEKVHIEIFKKDNKYSGKISWLEVPEYPADDEMAGKPKIDRNNPDPKLRTRPILGLEMLTGFEYAGKNKWKNGRIYDPENGKTYKCKMKLKDNGELKIRGYIGFSMLGRTTTWTRVK